jgi:FSR family fosmidomycin resistance protein-like MFS transporter
LANHHPSFDGAMELEPEAPVTDVEHFETGGVVALSVGHAIHDTYTGFLPPLLPLFITKLVLSKTEAGLLTAFMQIPSILQPVIGHLADRISLRFLVFLAPALTGTMMCLLGVAPTYLLLAFALTIAGLSSAGLHAVAPAMAGRLSKRSLGRGMSFWMVGGELGRTLGPLVIVSAIGILTLEGTYWLMIGGWLTSALLIFSLRDVSGRPPRADQSLPWRAALREMRPLMLPLAALVTVGGFMSAAVTTFLPTFLIEEGADLWLAGASLSILEVAGALGAFFGGSLSDRWGRKLILFLSMLISPLLLFVFLGFDGWAQIAVLPLLGFAVLSPMPVLMALVQECYPENRALANGIYMAMAFLIRSVVVVLLGGIGDLLGLRQGFIISAVLMLLGTPLVMLLPRGGKPAGE